MQNQTRNLAIVALVAALVAVTCWKQSSGQGESAKPVAAKWEYTTLTLSLIDSAEKRLTALSSERGYELVATYQDDAGKPVAILRRPKADK